MGTVLKANKRVGVIVGVVVIALGVSLGLFLHRSTPYSPTTFARLQRTSSKAVCVQKPGEAGATVDSQSKNFIENTIATSITDALAGTDVEAYFKTYDGSTATGTTAYSGKYGSYNFTVKKVDMHPGSSYLGGWQVTRFQPCKA